MLLMLMEKINMVYRSCYNLKVTNTYTYTFNQNRNFINKHLSYITRVNTIKKWKDRHKETFNNSHIQSHVDSSISELRDVERV